MTHVFQDRETFLDALRALAEVFGPLHDPDCLTNLDPRIAPIVIPLYGVLQRYFRARVVGLEHMPEGKALVVGNHNAGITFLEPIILGREWHRRTGGEDDFLFLVHDAMVALPVLGNVLMKCGAVRASRKVAGRIFAAGRKMVTFPGGNREAFRPWTKRHEVQFHGRKGFARLAIRHRAPIVPMLNVGGHDTFFVLWQGRALARWTGAKRLLRSDSFPLFLGLPWGLGFGPIFHFPLPARMHIELGEPIPTAHLTLDEGSVQGLYDEVLARVQAMMDRHRRVSR